MTEVIEMTKEINKIFFKCTFKTVVGVQADNCFSFPIEFHCKTNRAILH